jgi:ABC-2 type transport system permease protein
MAVAAIGLACSSLTQSQIVAAVLAYAIPFVIIDFTWLQPLLSEGLADILSQLALQAHFDSFARGVIELRRGLYFGGIIVLGYTVSVGSLEFARAR